MNSSATLSKKAAQNIVKQKIKEGNKELIRFNEFIEIIKNYIRI